MDTLNRAINFWFNYRSFPTVKLLFELIKKMEHYKFYIRGRFISIWKIILNELSVLYWTTFDIRVHIILCICVILYLVGMLTLSRNFIFFPTRRKIVQNWTWKSNLPLEKIKLSWKRYQFPYGPPCCIRRLASFMRSIEI